LGILRKRLLEFLRKSQYYAPEKMLSKFPPDELLEERAILLSRIGRHPQVRLASILLAPLLFTPPLSFPLSSSLVQALAIYAHKLHDVDAAENYCAQFFSDQGEEKSIYLSLLQVYLKPPGLFFSVILSLSMFSIPFLSWPIS
jgi:hypothetical protein